MKLFLDHRWEHALIAETIAKAAEKSGRQVGRTAMQKLLYFMQVLGVPMRYRFEIYHYGPFCSAILQDVEWLVSDEVIRDDSSEERCSDYKPGPSIKELQNQFSGKLDDYKDKISEVVEALADLDPQTLELIATLHYCFRWVKAKGGDGPWRELTIAKFKEVKGTKFLDEQINMRYDELVRAELIEA